MDAEAARVEHLKLIQAVVDRLGRSSFAVKSTAAAAAAALSAFTASAGSPPAALAGLAVPLLWLLDARFLEQERGFRRLYDSVRRGAPPPCGSDDYFTMDAPPARRRSDRLVGVAVSPSLCLFYTPLLALIVASALTALL